MSRTYRNNPEGIYYTRDNRRGAFSCIRRNLGMLDELRELGYNSTQRHRISSGNACDSYYCFQADFIVSAWFTDYKFRKECEL